MKLNILLLFLILILNISCKQKTGDNQPQTNLDKTNLGEYRIGIYKAKTLDLNPNKITHIVIIGSALKEDSDQFFQSGISRAQRYYEQWPDHQIIFMSSPDVKGISDDQIFDKYKIKVSKIVSTKFTAPLLLNEIAEFNSIASLDFYGHASPWAMIIGKSGAAFDPSAHYLELEKIRYNFLPNAYATLNGCNTGFYLAPDLSRGLGIPVSGSLTSSMFERIESDGSWYKEDDWNQRGYVLNNKFSYTSGLSCSKGFCTRMKPSRENYSSFWGTFSEGGLSFDKFFCNYENNSDGNCERAMALSLLGFPSVHPIDINSSREEYKQVVYDWLCSTGKSKSYFKKCVRGIQDALDNGDLIYQSHPTNELNCDFNSCHAKVICKYKAPAKGSDEGPMPGSCNIDTIPNTAPKNIAREYLSFMRGFGNIQNQ
ncbi:MAG: hypothetical protein Q7U04_15550 [Bacteriovorax sp.]|nr:hypothetical protein [Bacteriovorax sp.]